MLRSTLFWEKKFPPPQKETWNIHQFKISNRNLYMHSVKIRDFWLPISKIQLEFWSDYNLVLKLNFSLSYGSSRLHWKNWTKYLKRDFLSHWSWEFEQIPDATSMWFPNPNIFHLKWTQMLNLTKYRNRNFFGSLISKIKSEATFDTRCKFYPFNYANLMKV